MKVTEFKSKLGKLVDSAKSGKKLRYSENHYTSKIIIPFFEKTLGLSTVFDDIDSCGKRPDVRCYSNSKDADFDENCLVVIESKLPNEFKGLDDKKVVNKYLDDKIVPYLIAHEDSVKYFILHSFTRFLFFKVNDDLILDLHRYKSGQLSRDKALKVLRDKLNSVNLEQHLKKDVNAELSSLVTILKTDFSKKCFANQSRNNVKKYVIKNSQTLKKFCVDLSESIIGDIEHNGFYQVCEDHFNFEMEKRTSPVRISYRLFLSTRYPDLTSSTEIDKQDSEVERELFVLSSVYNVVGKLFIQKYVEDMFSGENGIFSKDFSFISSKTPEEDNFSDFLNENFESIAKNSTEAYKKIISRNDYFNWIVSSNCVNNSQFERVFQIFKGMDLNKSIIDEDFQDDILGAFFEVFSEKFNKNVRKVFGQYYTPKDVVSFIWDRVLKVVDDEGLDHDDIKLLDPACGSGTFLVEGIKKLSEATNDNLANKVVAFDISPMAAGLAEINIFAEMLKVTNEESVKDINKINVYNTDSLKISESSYWQTRLDEEDDLSRLRMIENQKRISKKYKKSKEYTLVVTNPPYNGSSSRNLDSFKGKFTLLDYLIQNRHPDDRIRDDYVWFMGAIDRYINDNGVVGLITSDTYLYRNTYRSLRKYLYENYRVYEIYQLGENIFDDVKVATSIIILSKFDDVESLKKKDYQIDYYDLTELKEDKKNRSKDERYLFLNGKKDVEPLKLTPSSSSTYSFIRSTDEVSTKNCIPLFDSKSENSIIKNKFTGIVTGYREFFSSDSKDVLKDRIQQFFKLVSIAKSGKKYTMPNCTNAQIKGFGEELLNSHVHSKYQKKLDKYITEYDLLPLRNKENAPRYISYLVASCLLKNISFDDKFLKLSVILNENNRWGFPKEQNEYLYYDDRLCIPRVNKNGSKITGGPITCWSKEADAEDKAMFVIQREVKGFSLMMPAFDNLYNPHVLKDVPKKGKAHYFRISDLEVPKIFLKYNFSKNDLFLYSQAIINSSWVKNNSEYITSTKVQVPLPNSENINLLRKIVLGSSCINDCVRLALYKQLGKRHLKKSKPIEKDVLKKLKITGDLNSALKKINMAEIEKIKKKYIGNVDSNIESVFRINNSIEEDLTSEVHGKILKFEPKTKFDKVLEKRLSLAAYIMSKLDGDKYLGRTKFQKAFFIVDTIIDENLKTKYHREAAGPLDYSLIYGDDKSIESLAKTVGLFDVEETPKLSKYSNYKETQHYLKIADKLIESDREEISKILRVLKVMNTTQAEIFATLYAIWNDLLIQGEEVEDSVLIDEFFNHWHKKKKEKFKGEVKRIKVAIKFMKDNHISPLGRKNKTLPKVS